MSDIAEKLSKRMFSIENWNNKIRFRLLSPLIAIAGLGAGIYIDNVTNFGMNSGIILPLGFTVAATSLGVIILALFD